MSTPTAFEQEMLELINRVRADPSGEFDKIILNQSTGQAVETSITQAISFFGVDLALFKTQMAAFGAVAPLAWNDSLSNAALAHTSLMIAQDTQSHQLAGEAGLGTRISAAGYQYSNVGENIYAYTTSPEQGHAGFIIDWGYGPGGMQSPAGHRLSILSSTYQEVGIGVTAESIFSTQVGPYVVTQDFGRSFSYSAQLVGSVINDADGDKFYDIGEGLGGVNVIVSGSNGTYSTQTWNSGGYQLVVPAGSYTVTFSGGGLGNSQSKTFSIGADNVKVDALAGDAPAVDLTAVKELITKIYVGYYDRAPDPEGLDYWMGRYVDGMSAADIAQSYSVQIESVSNYPYLASPGTQSSTGFITSVYNNLFNRAPDAPGLVYWEGQLASGRPVGAMILDIINGAVTAPDKTILDFKVLAGIDWATDAKAATNFTYNTAAAANAHSVLAGITASATSVTQAAVATDAFFASPAPSPLELVSANEPVGFVYWEAASANEVSVGVDVDEDVALIIPHDDGLFFL